MRRLHLNESAYFWISVATSTSELIEPVCVEEMGIDELEIVAKRVWDELSRRKSMLELIGYKC